MKLPTISNKSLEVLSSKIRPLIKRGDFIYWQDLPEKLTQDQLRREAYHWSAKLGGLANVVPSGRFGFGDIVIFSRWGQYSMLKVSIAEVLSQLPDDEIPGCVGWTMEGPKMASDFNSGLEKDILNQGYHVVRVQLYKMAE